MRIYPSLSIEIIYGKYDTQFHLFVNKAVDVLGNLCYDPHNFIFDAMKERISFRRCQRAGGCCEPVPMGRVTASGACLVKAYEASNRARMPRDRL